MRLTDITGTYTLENISDETAVKEDISSEDKTKIAEQAEPTEVKETEQETADQVNQDTETVAQAEVELMTAQEASTKAIDLASSLDELESSTQKIVDENAGSLPVPAATIAQASMESIMACLGISYKPAVTLESLRGTYSKKAATAATLESFKDNIKKAFDAVISAIKNTVSAVFGFVASLINSKSAIEKVLKDNLNKLKAISKEGTKAKVPQIYGSFIDKLTVSGNLDPDKVISDTEKLTHLYSSMSDTIKELRDRGGLPDGVETRVSKTLDDLFSSDTRAIKKPDGKYITVYGHFAGDAGVFVGENGYTLQILHGRNDYSAMTPINTPAINDTISLTEKTIALLNKMNSIENQLDTVKSLVLGMLRGLENEYNRLRSAMGSEEHEKRTLAFKKAKDLQKVMNGSITRIPLLVIQACKVVAALSSAVCLAYT